MYWEHRGKCDDNKKDLTILHLPEHKESSSLSKQDVLKRVHRRGTTFPDNQTSQRRTFNDRNEGKYSEDEGWKCFKVLIC